MPQRQEWNTVVVNAMIQSLKFKRENKEFDMEGLEDLIEAQYLKNKREDGPSNKKSFSPSSLGYQHGTCPRFWHLSFGGAFSEDFSDAKSMANMSNGSYAHDRIQKLFESSDILIAKEMKVTYNDPPILGYADVLVRWQGERVVGEIKTARDESFIHRRMKMQAMGGHLLQTLIYMDRIGTDKGFLLYENKNSQEFLTILVEMTERNRQILDEAYEWMRNTHKAFKDDTLPTRPFKSIRNKVCKTCPVKKVCWEVEPDGVVTLPVLQVPAE